jgi:hypothetical protein
LAVFEGKKKPDIDGPFETEDAAQLVASQGALVPNRQFSVNGSLNPQTSGPHLQSTHVVTKGSQHKVY